MMCDRDGRLVLTDFGAGCDLEESTEGGHARAGRHAALCCAGSASGQPATPQSDVYSLGVFSITS